VPEERYPVSFALLLNLVSASHAHSRDVLWGFIRAYSPQAVSPQTNPGLDRLVGFALRYYEDFVKPSKVFRAPDEKERAALEDLAQQLERLGQERTARSYKMLSMRSARHTASSRCARGSRRFTKCCSARHRDRASAPLPPCSAARRPQR